MFRQKPSFVGAFIRLNGHLLGSAGVFVSFVAMGWVTSFLLHLLHSLYPFPGEILSYLKKCELYLIYGDSILCAVILLCGAISLVREEFGG